VEIVELKIVFLSIGFEEIFCQSKDQHHESQSLFLSLSIKIKCINILLTEIELIFLL